MTKSYFFFFFKFTIVKMLEILILFYFPKKFIFIKLLELVLMHGLTKIHRYSKDMI